MRSAGNGRRKGHQHETGRWRRPKLTMADSLVILRRRLNFRRGATRFFNRGYDLDTAAGRGQGRPRLKRFRGRSGEVSFSRWGDVPADVPQFDFGRCGTNVHDGDAEFTSVPHGVAPPPKADFASSRAAEICHSRRTNFSFQLLRAANEMGHGRRPACRMPPRRLTRTDVAGFTSGRACSYSASERFPLAFEPGGASRREKTIPTQSLFLIPVFARRAGPSGNAPAG